MIAERDRVGCSVLSSEKELIRRALKGDQRAFGTLYRTHLPCVHWAVASRTANREDAEDLVQVTFMQAFRALKDFRGDAAFSTWLTRIALNVCGSHFRAQQAWQRGLDAAREAGSPFRGAWQPAFYEDPEEAMDRRQRQQLVTQGIQALPESLRRAVWLRYAQERSYLEITRALRAPMGTVKTWLCRARRQLKGEFQRSGVYGV